MYTLDKHLWPSIARQGEQAHFFHFPIHSLTAITKNKNGRMILQSLPLSDNPFKCSVFVMSGKCNPHFFKLLMFL